MSESLLALAAALVLLCGAIFYAVRRLRPLRSGTVGEVHLPVRRDDPPTCGNCRHFDLEEGQALMLYSNPAFAEVMRVTRPADHVQHRSPLVPMKRAWSEFGLCRKHSNDGHDLIVSAGRLFESRNGTAEGCKPDGEFPLKPGEPDCFEPRTVS